MIDQPTTGRESADDNHHLGATNRVQVMKDMMGERSSDSWLPLDEISAFFNGSALPSEVARQALNSMMPLGSRKPTTEFYESRQG